MYANPAMLHAPTHPGINRAHAPHHENPRSRCRLTLRRMFAVTNGSPVVTAPSMSSRSEQLGIDKAYLLRRIASLERGASASPRDRREVDEAQILVESHAAPTLDLHQLSGKWRMLYTTARDVIPLVRANTLPSFLPQPLRVGPIFQEFDDRGGVRNVIEAEALLPPGRGTRLTFQVEARYQRRGPRSLGLRFVAAGVPHLEPSASLRAFLAPALAPRGWWTHRLLLAAQQAHIRVPLVPPPILDAFSAQQGEYLLSYLDDTMLIGRTKAGGGTFIFSREPDIGDRLLEQESRSLGPISQR
ncbi:hypothetical protein ACKKBG_A10445 [Auxenochlorella protothecoides x Auxenochlorella symbiontica]